MYALGIKPVGHDTAAALVKDGKIIAASSQERFDRTTHSNAFPLEAIKFCLSEADININEVDEIAIPYNYDEAIIKLFFLRTLKYLPKSLLYLSDFKKVLVRKRRILKTLKQDLRYKNKITFLDHHDCHAASTYYCSPFNKAVILTIDGRGEWATSRMYLADGKEIKRIDQMNYPHSIGLIYENVTTYLGFTRNSDEGKIMGLSSYGKPHYYPMFKKLVKTDGDWKFKLNLTFFNHHIREQAPLPYKFVATFGNPRKKDSAINKRHKDIASSLQKITNEIVLKMALKAKSIRNDNNLCIAGGVGLNAVSNGVIYKENIFENIFVQPASGDDGTSLGAALLSLSRYTKSRIITRPFSPYLGIKTNDAEIKKAINIIKTSKSKVQIRKLKNPSAEAATQIAKGKIIGWFQGKAEFGPRALGNRSILADPRNPKMKDILNLKVKFREPFRPFAPSVLEEEAHKYFEIKKPIPYMTIVVDTIKSKKSKIPSVVHVDNTVRVQTVSKELNPKYYKLIFKFYQITKVPVVLNTSLNIRGEPIANNPEEAISCFLKTGMDILYIENYEFKKQNV
jgi:carbamoyltransferase